VGDVIEIVFRNSLPNAVNLVFNGGLIPDDPSYLTAAISPGQTVRERSLLRLARTGTTPCCFVLLHFPVSE